MKMFRKDEGFTLVELMVVVLIIGILVAIAVPVFLNASANAQAKSCQANQRTVVGAISTYNATYPAAAMNISDAAVAGVSTAPELLGGAVSVRLFTAGTYNSTATNPVIKSIPLCPVSSGQYSLGLVGAATNSVTGDKGDTTATGASGDFQANHKL